MRKDKTQYQSKVTIDTGMARSRVPAPLLKRMGARAGDYLIFRLASSGEAIVRVSRVKPAKDKSKRR